MPKLHTEDEALQWIMANEHADDLTVLSYEMRDLSTRMSNERPGDEVTEVAYNQLNDVHLVTRTHCHKWVGSDGRDGGNNRPLSGIEKEVDPMHKLYGKTNPVELPAHNGAMICSAAAPGHPMDWKWRPGMLIC